MNLEEEAPSPEDYILPYTDLSCLDDIFILKHSAEHIETDARLFFELQPSSIHINAASFTHPSPHTDFREVTVIRRLNTLVLTCACETPRVKMCKHQAQVLYNISRRPELRIFFDEQLRHQKMLLMARDYGLEKEPYLDRFFDISYLNKSISITPKTRELLAVTTESTQTLKAALLPAQQQVLPATTGNTDRQVPVIIFSEHKYYKQYKVMLYNAVLTGTGKVRSLLQLIDPSGKIWEAQDPQVIKFYSALSKFQHSYEEQYEDATITGLKALIKNPLDLPAFLHDPEVSGNLNSTSLVPVNFDTLNLDLQLSIDLRNDFYELSGQLSINESSYPLQTLRLQHYYFIHYHNTLHLVDNIAFLKVIDFLRKNNNKVIVHASRFELLRQEVLTPLEHKVSINYSYLKPASKAQLEEFSIAETNQLILYLSDSLDHVLITPVIKYGPIEVPVLSRLKIYAHDQNGTEFVVERNTALEARFMGILLLQCPAFNDQLHGDYFYLPKATFLDEGWFLDAFETWRQHDITVLGFNELKDNRKNPYRASVSVAVNSGLDWFETSIAVQYGPQKASLKHLHKAIRSKSRFVQLDDGTLGLLPAEWLDRMAGWFQAGTVEEELVLIPKISFNIIQELFEQDVLGKELKAELNHYQKAFSGNHQVEPVAVPPALNGVLRDYQHEGLNWLCFLDRFHFGACLADDMGLGKTLQIIAFILCQRSKSAHNTNLVIVPTTLIFNWQAELQKFAPSIKVLTIYGADRIKNSKTFDDYEVILTSYGTLLSDIRLWKQYRFNYIILDESQNIKNPESQRYKAVKLLQSRNRIILTGTPIENNTYDLYAQLSFACPGLLGSKQHFKEQYAIPIDKFKLTQKARELQQKISPFILRRTKKQVAKELPEKTEMILYCEMSEEQQQVYDYYRKEYRDFLLSKQDDELMKYSMHVLKGLTLLRQICDSPALLKDKLVTGSASSKMDTLMEEIESKAGQHKILIFSQFVSMLDLIRTQLDARNINYQYLTGQTKNREEQVAAFQGNSEVRVFLISLKAGGTGLNLTEADYVYIVDPWWNPAVENQAIDRCYRIGQQKKVVAVRLICPGTIEEKILKLQETKKELVGDLVKTDGAFLKRLDKADLVALFS